MDSAKAPPRQWLQLSCQVHAEAVEAVSELFRRHIPSGVSIEEAIKPTGADRGRAEGWSVDLTRPAKVSAFVPADERAGAIRHQLEEGLWHLGQLLPVYSFETRVLSEQDWAQAWREHYQVHRVGRRLVIKPSWREYEPGPGELVIELDPGMAFGTGLHPTTQLCLRELEERVKPGMRVADIGTGSGILSIAAALLGAKRVFACDTDPVAVSAAQDNSGLNRLADVIEVRRGTIGGQQSVLRRNQHFDVVVANIVADVIAGLMPAVYDATAPGGAAIFSGIIDSREEIVAKALETVGFERLGRQQQGDWVMLAARRTEEA